MQVSQKAETIAIMFCTVMFILACAMMVRGAELPTQQDEVTTCTYLTAQGKPDSTIQFIRPSIEMVQAMNQAVYSGAVEAAIEMGVEKMDTEVMEQAEALYSCVGEVATTAQIAINLHAFCRLGLADPSMIDSGFLVYGFLSFAQSECKPEFNAFFEGATPAELLEALLEPAEKDSGI
jgi:hypothetical protein